MLSVAGYDVGLRLGLLGADAPPAVPGSLDDEFLGSALNTSRWTWLDQGDITAHIVGNQYDSRLMLMLRENSNRIRGIYQSAPSGSWTVQAKVFTPTVTATNAGPHLFAAQSTSGAVLAVSRWADILRALSFSTPSSAGTGTGLTLNDVLTVAYHQLEWNGTDLIGSVSPDGRVWSEVLNTAPGYTPAIVGLGITNANGSLGTYEFGWFRRVA
jgi:hypothetical protein